MSVKERLKLYISIKGIKESAFCRSIGAPKTFISSMRISTKPEKLSKIVVIYPDLNLSWLLTGEGKMLKSEIETETGINNDLTNDDIIEKLNQRVLKLEKELSNANETIHNLGALLVDAHHEITRLKSIDDHESFLKRGKRQIKTR